MAHSLAAGMATIPPPGGRTVFLFCLTSAALQPKRRKGHSGSSAVKMPESPLFLGTPILLEVGSFIASVVRSATIAFCLTHIISMSLSAYSLGSSVVGGFRLRLELRARGCSRMSVVTTLSGAQRAPQGARH